MTDNITNNVTEKTINDNPQNGTPPESNLNSESTTEKSNEIKEKKKVNTLKITKYAGKAVKIAGGVALGAIVTAVSVAGGISNIRNHTQKKK